jgi:pimeloyl-ACP methyl ester carboxylesterase
LGIDETMLVAHRAYANPAAGISEEFLRPVLGGRHTVAVLTRPTVPARPLGWVLCHSFAREQTVLKELDAFVARSLAAVGFPVLRYHGQGYGDSEGRMEDVTLSSHLDDAGDAVEVLREKAGVEAVGIAGARFGGTVAALAAERLELPLMALWDPVVSGSQFMRRFLRTKLFFEAVEEGRDSDPSASNSTRKAGPEGNGDGQGAPAEASRTLREVLHEQHWVDVQGFSLSERAHDEVAAVDLRRDLSRFRGACLVTFLSRSGETRPDIAKLADHLRALGAECDVELVPHRTVAEFGLRRYMDDGENVKVDVQLELSNALAALTTRWAEKQVARWPVPPERA